MGFLDRLRSSQNTQNEQWQTLNSLDQLDQIDEDSRSRPVVLFKHSTTCGISANAKHRLEAGWDDVKGEFDFYYLDLLSYRPISNEIAQRYSIRHESPQILVIRDGACTYDTSHHRINAAALSEALV